MDDAIAIEEVGRSGLFDLLGRLTFGIREAASAVMLVAGLSLVPTYPARPPEPAQPMAAAGIGTVEIGWAVPLLEQGRPVHEMWVYRDGSLLTKVPVTEGVTFVDRGLGAAETHSYQVAAYNKVGLGPLSEPTLASTFGVPGPPTSANVRPTATQGAVTVLWDAPKDTGGPTITSYNVYRDGQLLAALPAGIRSFTHVGMKVGGTYNFEVAAVNAVGEGARTSTMAMKVAPVAQTVKVEAKLSERFRTPFQLVAGQTYLVEARGTYAYGVGVADAECSATTDDATFQQNRWRRIDARGDLLDVYVGNVGVSWTPVNPTPQGCSADHVYQYRLTPKADGLAELGIYDVAYHDNRGALLVTITPLDQ